jgi:Icc-related predicted phosphoesterase
MKIAFCADVHISSAHPERLGAFQGLLQRLESEEINTLVVTGDLLHAVTKQDTSSVDQAMAQHPDIALHIVPGNHDLALTEKYFTSTNITVHSDPEILDCSEIPMLVVPYTVNSNMGASIEPFSSMLKKEQWILVSHGDWGPYAGSNPMESNAYFPLSSNDISFYRPHVAILGHIHKHVNDEKVVYPGSLHPLDITETGPRRYIVLEDEKIRIERFITPHTNYVEQVVIYPDDDEMARERIRSWCVAFNRHVKEDIGEGNDTKVRLRLSVLGATHLGKQEVCSLFEEHLDNTELEKLDTSKLEIAESGVFDALFSDARQRIDDFDLDGEYMPSKEEIVSTLADMLYGVR